MNILLKMIYDMEINSRLKIITIFISFILPCLFIIISTSSDIIFENDLIKILLLSVIINALCISFLVFIKVFSNIMFFSYGFFFLAKDSKNIFEQLIDYSYIDNASMFNLEISKSINEYLGKLNDLLENIMNIYNDLFNVSFYYLFITMINSIVLFEKRMIVEFDLIYLYDILKPDIIIISFTIIVFNLIENIIKIKKFKKETKYLIKELNSFREKVKL